ncbi:MAG: hypothetical protein HOM55_06595 [Proteobacteria bacterium]|nr:hypothetical protein [Pseudomonadota bacterium]
MSKPYSIANVLLAGLFISANPTFAQSDNEHPDLSGNWNNGSGIDFVQPKIIGASICVAACDEAPPTAAAVAHPPPDRPKYKPEFAAKVRDLNERQVEEDSILRCMSPGVPRIGPPDMIVQQTDQIVFLYDDVNGNYFRVVPLDGRGHRTDIEASALGDAIGYWEGDTLVVETNNLTDDTWLTDDGSFHTTGLKVTERISRDGDTLRWEVVAEDPAVLAEPWELRPRIATLTDVEILQAPPCLERDLPLMENMTHHPNIR